MSPAIRKLEDVTPEFLSQALRATVTSYSSERIGTGLVGECHRISLDYAPCATEGPASVVIKLAASDPASRKTGWQGKLYEHEARFYSEVAPGLNAPSIPKCYHASVNKDDGTFDLLLEDIHPASVGNELTGATLEQARSALIELAKLQKSCTRSTAPEWLKETVPLSQAFMQQIWAMFVNTYQDAVKAEHRHVCERFLAVYDDYRTRQSRDPTTLSAFIHGDFRLDNMLFNYSPERPFIVVDWQIFAGDLSSVTLHISWDALYFPRSVAHTDRTSYASTTMHLDRISHSRLRSVRKVYAAKVSSVCRWHSCVP